jgi:hypothetical protein
MATPRIKLSAGLIAALAAAWNPSYAAGEPVSPLASVQAQPTPAEVVTSAAIPAPAQAAVAQPPRVPGRTQVSHPVHRSANDVLDERVAALGQALKLDANQKVALREILVSGRDELRQVWSDTARTSAERIGMSQTVNQRTEDRIRSILNEEQRSKYIAPKPAGSQADRPEHDLDFWMDQTHGAH